MKCGVFFAVRTEFLNIIYTRFGFKGLNGLSNGQWLQLPEIHPTKILFLKDKLPDNLRSLLIRIKMGILSAAFCIVLRNQMLYKYTDSPFMKSYSLLGVLK
jgi:hypothetical protein